MCLCYNDYHIFRSISRNFFFQKFHGSGLCANVSKKTTHYTLHTAACLDQHLITISSPTVLHNHWLSLQLCGHPSPPAVYCTHWQSMGKLPPDVRCWARSSGPQVAVVISRSARLNASRVDRVLPFLCQSSHHVYATEDVPMCKESNRRGCD